MLIRSLMPLPVRVRSNRANPFMAAGMASALLMLATSAQSQAIVFDPRNHVENALQAARQLESLANEARSLAASPYSHLSASSQALRDMGELAQTARGLGTSAVSLRSQFDSLYADDGSGLDGPGLIEASQARRLVSLRTSQDLALAAAQLEAQGHGRIVRLSGALRASEAAVGQTAATQSTNQLLAVAAEELAALRTISLAQSRLLAEAGARQAADRAAGEAARRKRWAGEAPRPAAPRFDPLPLARD